MTWEQGSFKDSAKSSLELQISPLALLALVLLSELISAHAQTITVFGSACLSGLLIAESYRMILAWHVLWSNSGEHWNMSRR